MNSKPDNERTIVSMAWYRPEDWEALRRISEDRDKLEETHAEWLEIAVARRADILAEGIFVHKVVIKPREWQRWCRQRRQPLNGASRADYAVWRMQQTHRNAGPDD
jgi:hypothetical protein